MSIHRQCGQEILWIKDPRGTWYPPFEPSDLVDTRQYILDFDDDDIPFVESVRSVKQLIVTLKKHVCPSLRSPVNEEVPPGAEWATLSTTAGKTIGTPPVGKPLGKQPNLVVLEAKIRREKEAKETATVKERERVVAIAHALAHVCPKCSAKKYRWCTSLAVTRDNSVKEVKVLHGERLAFAPAK